MYSSKFIICKEFISYMEQQCIVFDGSQAWLPLVCKGMLWERNHYWQDRMELEICGKASMLSVRGTMTPPVLKSGLFRFYALLRGSL